MTSCAITVTTRPMSGDIGLGTSDDTAIAAHALHHGQALIAADFDFADIRVYPPSRYYGIVVIDRPEDASIREVLERIESFLNGPDIPTSLAGTLVIVDSRRIRMRGG